MLECAAGRSFADRGESFPVLLGRPALADDLKRQGEERELEKLLLLAAMRN